MQFGRKSEKLDYQIEQLELPLEDLQANEGATSVQIPKTACTSPKAPLRKRLPEHLPRDTCTYRHLLDSFAGIIAGSGSERFIYPTVQFRAATLVGFGKQLMLYANCKPL